MLHNRVVLIAMVVTTVSTTIGDSVRADERRQLLNRVAVTAAPANITDNAALERLRNGISAKWNDSVERHRDIIQSYMELRLDQLQHLRSSDGHRLVISEAKLRRVRIASKGAIDSFLQQSTAKKGDWFDKQAKKALTRMKSNNSMSIEKALATLGEYDAEFSRDVDSVLTILDKVSKSAPLIKTMNSTLSDAHRQEWKNQRLTRLRATQAAYLNFIIALVDQRLLLSSTQRSAFKALIEKHQLPVTEKSLDNSDGWEEAITAVPRISKRELLKIFTVHQLRVGKEVLGELGVELGHKEEQSSEFVTFAKFEIHVREVASSFLETLAKKITPKQQVIQAERRANQLTRQTMKTQIDYIKLCTRMNVAEQRDFEVAAHRAIEEYVAQEFATLREKFVDENNEAKASVQTAKLNKPNDPNQQAQQDAPQLVAQVDHAGVVDLSFVEPLLEQDEDPQSVVADITSSDSWKTLLEKSITTKQKDRLRTDRIKRFMRPRDSYCNLIVFWMDRAMYLTPKKRQQLIALIKRNQPPVTAKALEEADNGDLWSHALLGIARTPKTDLAKILSANQMKVWTSTLDQFDMAEAVPADAEAEIEEEIVDLVEDQVEDEELVAEPRQ